MIVVGHRRIAGQVMRQVTPLTAGIEQVEDRIDDLAVGNLSWSAPTAGRPDRKAACNQAPLGVSQIGGISFAGEHTSLFHAGRAFLPIFRTGSKVVKIGSKGQVVLNKGAASRVRPGMLFAMEGFLPINLQVESVTEHEAIAKVLYFFNSDRRVQVGNTFTTGDYWDRPMSTG